MSEFQNLLIAIGGGTLAALIFHGATLCIGEVRSWRHDRASASRALWRAPRSADHTSPVVSGDNLHDPNNLHWDFPERTAA